MKNISNDMSLKKIKEIGNEGINMNSFDINKNYNFSNNNLLFVNNRKIFQTISNTSNFNKDIILVNRISKKKCMLDNKDENNLINEKNRISNDFNDIINYKNQILNLKNNEILLNENYSNLFNKKIKYDERDKRSDIIDLPNFPQFFNDKNEIMYKTQINKNIFNINDIAFNSNNILNNFHSFNNNDWNFLNNNFLIPNPLLQLPISSYLNKRPFFNSLDNEFNNYPMNLGRNGI